MAGYYPLGKEESRYNKKDLVKSRYHKFKNKTGFLDPEVVKSTQTSHYQNMFDSLYDDMLF